MVAHVTFRGHAFHPLDSRRGRRRVRAGRMSDSLALPRVVTGGAQVGRPPGGSNVHPHSPAGAPVRLPAPDAAAAAGPAARPRTPRSVYPAALQPAAGPARAARPAACPWRPPGPTGPSVDAGRFWAGVVATALVAALVGLVGVVIVDQILDIELVVQDVFGTGSIGRGVRRRRRARAVARRWAAAAARARPPRSRGRSSAGSCSWPPSTAAAPAADLDRRARVGDLPPACVNAAHRDRDLVAAARRAEPHPAARDPRRLISRRRASAPSAVARRLGGRPRAVTVVPVVVAVTGRGGQAVRRAGAASRAGRSRGRTGCR